MNYTKYLNTLHVYRVSTALHIYIKILKYEQNIKENTLR